MGFARLHKIDILGGRCPRRLPGQRPLQTLSLADDDDGPQTDDHVLFLDLSLVFPLLARIPRAVLVI